jgi:hypothetical protein
MFGLSSGFSGGLSPIAMLISLWATTKLAIWLYSLLLRPCVFRYFFG